MNVSVIVPSVRGGPPLKGLLDTLARQTLRSEVIVVDNGSNPGAMNGLADLHDDLTIIRLDSNQGFSRAVNIAARQAAGPALVLVNDDCRFDPGFVKEVVKPLDAKAGVVMSAGVLADPHSPGLIDSAGMELDSTLLGFDYLNGEPLACLDEPVPDPVGPCGAAAAFDRDAFLDAGGFDEELFAYWEVEDLVLRLRLTGGRCVLARAARGVHEHSATLGSGSTRKNYLMGFGRGYTLRKWNVLAAPRRALGFALRDGVICAGQALVDRNLSGIKGRFDGFRAASRCYDFPDDAVSKHRRTRPLGTLRRRASRRIRLRRRAAHRG